ncbi:MAG: hypothetical protein RPU64_14800 [Candidatus Sedimenticola sp. (ex Thyasira tokunagai)]
MTKKGNLAAALTGFDRRPSETAQPKPVQADTAQEVRTEQTQAGEGGKNTLPPSRRGKKALTGYFDPEVLKQLKVLAVAEDKTMQTLMSEGINELFKKYGRPHIA